MLAHTNPWISQLISKNVLKGVHTTLLYLFTSLTLNYNDIYVYLFTSFSSNYNNRNIYLFRLLKRKLNNRSIYLFTSCNPNCNE